MLFPPARQFSSSLIDGCLKYKHKEKPKTGPRPGPRLNYDVKIGPIAARWGWAEMQGSSVPLGRDHVSPSGAPSHCRALRIVLTFPPLTAPLPTAFTAPGGGGRWWTMGPPPVRGDPSWGESPMESHREGKSGPRTTLGPARTRLLAADGPRPGALSPELRGAEQSGGRRTDEASAKSVP